ncbi:MAG TPA: acyl-CoA thioesterase [Firmicutes bacterium]|nr:acyl-CoA thioesterase [Bacillota bacterium]
MISETQIIVRYAETDQMGIAHHSMYAVWYEAARTEFIRKLGMRYSDVEKAGILLPLTELTSRYIRAAFYEDVLSITVRIQKLTVSRISFAYTVRRQGETEILNEGTTTHGFVNTSFRPVNLKKYAPDIYALMMRGLEE